jgi:DNA-binding MarR family transcriptional regulator
MDDDKVTAIQDIVLTFRKLVSAVHLNSPRMKKQSGLTGPQVEALRILAREGSLSSAALSRKLCVTPSNITGIIDRLEKKGLVERVRGLKDRRISQLELTPAGKVMNESLPSSIEGTLINGLVDMSEEEISELATQLQKFLDLLQVPKSISQITKLDSPSLVTEGSQQDSSTGL